MPDSLVTHGTWRFFAALAIQVISAASNRGAKKFLEACGFALQRVDPERT
jgi:hypothetical protein